MVDAGFPAGAVNVVHGRGDVGAALTTHDGVDGIGFVGSADTAEAIVRAAGLKRTLIEASGNGPQIVCDDADLARAAEAAVFGATFVAGGAHTGWGRIGGKYALRDMTDLRTTVIDVR